MIDWLTGFYRIESPAGDLVCPSSIPGLVGNRVFDVVPTSGEVVREGFRERRFGRASGLGSTLTTKVYGNRIWIHGNPTSGCQGTNGFSELAPWETVGAWYRLILRAIGIPDHHLILERLTRLDLTQQVDCESKERAAMTLERMKHAWTSPKKMKTNESHSAYLGKRSHGWSAKAYVKRSLNAKGMASLSEFLRIEIVLRSLELNRLTIDPNLGSAPLESLFCRYLERTHLSGIDASAPEGFNAPAGLSGSRAGYVSRWLQGEQLRASLPRSTFHAIRKDLMAYDIDIATPPQTLPACAAPPLTWSEIRDPSRWYATRYVPSDVVAMRFRRGISRSTRSLQRSTHVSC
jgi:hypothetical protein